MDRSKVVVVWALAATAFVVGCRSKPTSERFIDAVLAGDVGTVTKLLEADPSVVKWKSSEMGLTPLHAAAMNGRTEVAQLLLVKGADINATTQYGETPLYIAARGCRGELVKLLIAKGADVNARSEQGTPLWVARQSGCEQTIIVLREHGGTE